VSAADLVTALYVALTVDVDDADTALVLTVNAADLAPAATRTLAGAEPGAVALRVTVIPPVGAGPLMFTVPVDEVPPVTLVGLTETLSGAGASTVTVQGTDLPLAVAVTVAGVFVDTGIPVTTNVAVVAPAEMVMLPGTVTGPLALKLTVIPPVGAPLPIVSFAVVEPPGAIVVGLQTRVDGMGPFTVRMPEAELPFAVAVTVDVVLAAMALVVTLNVADVLPAATVTLAGTEAPDVLLRATTSPPVMAGEPIVTVAVDDAPPVTLVGLNVRLVGYSLTAGVNEMIVSE